ncbi:MAG: CPBP family intramembrane metalloprotease [Clostridiaceae bacterium]|jgi:membrane protease YdiL (CAAX protease family)|nr:CPBP family intramembrane metalloprotease [Clostridiaceae bacterium]
MVFWHRSLVIKHKLGLFFGLAYLLSWLLWAPSILSSRGLLPFQLPDTCSIAGNFGPALAAILTITLAEGKKGLVAWFKSLVPRHVSWKLLALALTPIGINGLLVVIYAVFSGDGPQISGRNILSIIPLFVFWLIFGGPLGEETGWRGFALPILLKMHGLLPSSFILGAVWFGWHLVRYLDPRQAAGGVAAIGLFAVQVMIFSILFTWVYHVSQGSLLSVVLFHAAINSLQTIVTSLYPGRTGDDFGQAFLLVNAALVAIYLVWAILAALRLSGRKRQNVPDDA